MRPTSGKHTARTPSAEGVPRKKQPLQKLQVDARPCSQAFRIPGHSASYSHAHVEVSEYTGPLTTPAKQRDSSYKDPPMYLSKLHCAEEMLHALDNPIHILGEVTSTNLSFHASYQAEQTRAALRAQGLKPYKSAASHYSTIVAVFVQNSLLL